MELYDSINRKVSAVLFKNQLDDPTKIVVVVSLKHVRTTFLLIILVVVDLRD